VEKESPNLELSSAEKCRLKSVIDFFPSFEGDGVGITTLIEHSIDTSNAKPMKQRHCPLSLASEKLHCGKIDRSDGRTPSPSWSSHIVLIVKPERLDFV